MNARFPRLRRCLTLLTALSLWLPGAHAKDRLLATPYGVVANDLLTAFGAEVAECVGAIASFDVCFTVTLAGPSYLATQLEEVIDDYRSAGLSTDGWRAANGVWSVTLRFETGNYGELQVYLSEGGNALVRGVLVFVGP